jgi:uncharacterized protein (DUF433 family)
MKPTKCIAVGKYVVSDPDICHGQLTFKGTRILVETVLSYLADGRMIEWALAEWLRISLKVRVKYAS